MICDSNFFNICFRRFCFQFLYMLPEVFQYQYIVFYFVPKYLNAFNSGLILPAPVINVNPG